jgi:hypothetical protein
VNSRIRPVPTSLTVSLASHRARSNLLDNYYYGGGGGEAAEGNAPEHQLDTSTVSNMEEDGTKEEQDEEGTATQTTNISRNDERDKRDQ